MTSTPTSRRDVAVIGIACRFPDAPDHHRFFDNLRRGHDAVREIPASRWSAARYWSMDIEAPDRSTSKWLGPLEGVDLFDNAFFGISPEEAASMDPQQRILLEETWRCIEDSGVPLSELQAKSTSVHVGMMSLDHQLRLAAAGRPIDRYACPGSYGCMLPNRISYVLGLRGASVPVDAACASSLVALHQAKRTLDLGESEYAIAAAVCLHLHPFKSISLSKAHVFSPEGRCRTFDGGANGMVLGEGAGVLLLQPLPDAIRDRNHVYGVIRGSAIGHGGASATLTAPRVEGQRGAIRAAYEDAGVSPRTVTYVEAHGTGTPLGDPIEIEALTRVFREHTADRQFCGIGSVKTNIGHLDAAAGLAGVVKVLMMMRHREIPPSLHLDAPSPIIDFEGSPFAVVRALRPWRAEPGTPLRAGVSAFGYGGMIGHVVLESFPAPEAGEEDAGAYPFALSARSPAALAALVAEWRTRVHAPNFPALRLRDVSATLLTGRQPFAHRLGFRVKSHAELQARLEEAAPVARRDPTSFALHVGEGALAGYAPVRAAAARDGWLSRRLDQVTHALASRAGEAAARDFTTDSWPPARAPLFRFLVAHAFLSGLLDLGFSPEIIGGEGSGRWAALALGGVIGLEDGISALAGIVPLAEVRLSRPRIPFHGGPDGRVLQPLSFDEGYLRRLLSDLPIPRADFVSFIDRVRRIHAARVTFRRYLEEWDRPLGGPGSVGRALTDDALVLADPERAGREQALLLVIVASALRRMMEKWDLTLAGPEVSPGARELIDLASSGVMPAGALVTLLRDATPDLGDIVSTLSRRQRLLRSPGACPLLRERNRTLHEVADVSALLGGCAPAFGHSVVTFAPDLAESTEEACLRLWLEGVDIDWAKLFPVGTFRRVALPGHPFDRRSFALVEELGACHER